MSRLSPQSNPSAHHPCDVVDDIYRNHHQWLFSWLGKKLGCVSDAQDIGHDTFLKLISSQQINSLKEPRAYLLVIASRLLMNRYRRKKVEKEALQHISLIIENTNKRSPERIAVCNDLLRRVVLLLLEELPARPRQAFIMAKIDGMTYAQIARQLNVSQSSVKQYLAKVLIHCHQRMYVWQGEGPGEGEETG